MSWYESVVFRTLSRNVYEKKEFTQARILSFFRECQTMCKRDGVDSYVLECVFREMKMPPSNEVNIGMTMFGYQILFITMVLSYPFDTIEITKEEQDIVKEMKEELFETWKIAKGIEPCTNKQQVKFYKRDLLPLVGGVFENVLKG
jgi:hypothetical protein